MKNYFLGGTFNSVNKKIKKHAETPIPSSERIFIKTCRTADGKITYTTTPRPAQIVYMASIKFVNLGDSYVLPVKHTQEYNELSNMISRNLRELTPLKDVSGFETVAIHNFKTYVYPHKSSKIIVSCLFTHLFTF